MKTLNLLALIVTAFLFGCKASQPTGPPSGGPTPSLLEVTQVLNSTDSTFLAYSALNNGNPHLSIMQTASWVQAQQNVQSVTTLDSVNITITLKSGLQTTFGFDETDTAGISLSKGGEPRKDEQHLSVLGTQSQNAITNKNVLIYCAGYSQFYAKNNAIQTTVDILTNAGLTVTLLKDAQCTYQIVNTFPNYGLVIIDTHGLPDAFMIGTQIFITNSIVSNATFNAAIVAQGGQDMLNKLLSGELSLNQRIRGNTLLPYWKFAYKTSVVFLNVFLTTRYIDNIIPQMPNTVIMGSMCYSGWQNPLGTGYTPMVTSFMNRSPISYYGFAFSDGTSDSVSTPFALRMEDSLSNALANDLDSTGIANLQPDHQTEYFEPTIIGNDLYFKHFGADDYSYEKCWASLVDSRDNQEYATVCIGDQVWMAQNLNYYAHGSRCINDSSANCAIYGKMYDWPTLMQGASSSTASPSGVPGVCPNGWHVPSLAEFQTLITTLGGNAAAADAMKSTSPLWPSPNTGATNSSGFSALPASFGFADGQFLGVGGYSYFWTATQNPNGISADVMYLIRGTDTVVSANLVTSDLVPCRCVKN